MIATDQDGGTITYSIVGGADMARFTINAATGVLSFKTAPDYEVPSDSDRNNCYVVIVRATDNTNLTDQQTITVNVTDVFEGGSRTYTEFSDVAVLSDTGGTYYMLGGNDYAYGGSGTDVVYGGGGIDILLGRGGNDWLYGGDDTDYLFGGSGTNVLYGEGGVDALYSEGINDTLYGGEGGDYFYAYPGSVAPTAYVGNGNDIYVDLSGGSGTNDTFYGGDGQDYFYGSGGNDTFYGGAGVDVFLGGDGNDTFDGGTGTDYAYGGAGNDTYIVYGTNGYLVIYDFAAGGTEDVVRLIDTGITTYAQAQTAMTYYASINTTILTIDADTSVWFVGVHNSSLTAADFLFA